MKYFLILLLVLLLGAFFIPGLLSSRIAFVSDESRLGQSFAEFPRFEGLSLVKYSDAGKSFYLNSESASIQSKRLGFLSLGFFKLIEMEKVEMGFYKDKELISVVKSDKARMNLLTGDIVLYDEINSNGKENKVLVCKRANFYSQKGED